MIDPGNDLLRAGAATWFFNDLGVECRSPMDQVVTSPFNLCGLVFFNELPCRSRVLQDTNPFSLVGLFRTVPDSLLVVGGGLIPKLTHGGVVYPPS